MAELEATLREPLGTPGGVYDNALFEVGRGHVLVHRPSQAPPRRGRVHPVELPAVELTVATHVGEHDDIDVTYGEVGAWFAANALSVAGPVRESYLVGPRDTDDPSQWRTEIGLARVRRDRRRSELTGAPPDRVGHGRQEVVRSSRSRADRCLLRQSCPYGRLRDYVPNRGLPRLTRVERALPEPLDLPCTMTEFHGLQEQLEAALQANAPGSMEPHVVVSLPSHSMPERLLTDHAAHLPALEHRGLLDGLQVGRTPGARVVVVTSVAPSTAVLDYYAHLAQPDSPPDARRRLSCLVVPDDGARGVASKLLDRPELVEHLRRLVAGGPALIEPWNVTFAEVAVALAIGAPVNGCPHELWPLGFKSASRRLFREAGVPVPLGVEDVHDSTEVAAAVDAMRRTRPLLDRVVIKLDNSGAAQGNWVLPTRDDTGHELAAVELASRIDAVVPAWFLSDLRAGGVVEELVVGAEVTSPSAQVQIRPGGEVEILATHEQVLGGESGQVFTGSRFPADPSYAGALGQHAGAIGRLLAGRGALGWLAVDFVARRDAGGWALAAVDLNLRKGGTTHSFSALQHLVPGSYDSAGSRWVADADGGPRYYRSSDSVGGPRWLGMEPTHAITSLAAAGLAFDHRRGAGVVLHMFPSLDRDGTIGVTAIGCSAAEAQRLYDAVPAALEPTATADTG